MSKLVGRTGWIAYSVLALAAAGFYLFDAPVPARAGNCTTGQCVYADQCYDSGACRQGQRCNTGTWQDDGTCPC